MFANIDAADVSDVAEEILAPEIIEESSESVILSTDDSSASSEPEIERARPTPRRTRRLRRGKQFLDYAEPGKPTIKRYDLFMIQGKQTVRICSESSSDDEYR